MRDAQGNRLYRLGFVLVLAVAAGGLFLFLIHTFVIDLFLAAILAGLIAPSFRRAVRLLGGRAAAAAGLVVVAALLAVALPLAAIATIVASDAIQLSGATVAWMQQAIADPGSIVAPIPKSLAASRELSAALTWFLPHAASAVAALAGYLSASLSIVLRGVGRLFLDIFVISFALVYFLQHGPALIGLIEERIPVARPEAQAIVDKTLKITAATLRSIVIGGAVDGTLVGIGFAFAGIGQPLFWGAVALVASQTPVLGCAVVWIPAAAFLLLAGHVLPGIALALWGTLISTVVDNFLRAYIVGRGGAIPAFLVLVSTLGGIAVFGAAGVLIGPVLTGVTIGIFDLYHRALKSSGLLDTGD